MKKKTLLAIGVTALMASLVVNASTGPASVEKLPIKPASILESDLEANISIEDHFEKILNQRFKGISVYKAFHDEKSGLYTLKTNASIIYTNFDGSRTIMSTGRSPYPELLDLTLSTDDINTKEFEKYNQYVIGKLKPGIIYKADNEKHVVKVFTDPACGYCQLLHSQISEYNELGITLEYYPFPAYGGPVSHDSLSRVLSLPKEEQKDAMDLLKKTIKENKGKEIDYSSIGLGSKSKDAEDMVTVVTGVGRMLGFSGTPGLVLPNGKAMNGYLDPKNLNTVLNK